jgi:hypothetical protein
MQIPGIAKIYETKSDDELLRLATNPNQLTPEARTALTAELSKRRVDVPQKSNAETQNVPARRDERRAPPIEYRPDAIGVGEFMGEVLQLYHRHFRFFIKLVAPAVVVGYVAVFMGQREALAIVRHLFRSSDASNYSFAIFQMILSSLAGYFVSWLVFSVSFGAICSAVPQIEVGMTPSIRESFEAVRQRLGSFLRLSLLLFGLFLVAELVARVLARGVFWFSQHRHLHLGTFSLQIISFGLVGLPLLILSRFALAMPAVILDNSKTGEAMFRSDEFTGGKWLILAALLGKCLIGGYVAAMSPFWLASWISASVPLPFYFSWVLTGASLAAVTVIEPTMFIGFALLYPKMSARSLTLSEALARQLGTEVRI